MFVDRQHSLVRFAVVWLVPNFYCALFSFLHCLETDLKQFVWDGDIIHLIWQLNNVRLSSLLVDASGKLSAIWKSSPHSWSRKCGCWPDFLGVIIYPLLQFQLRKLHLRNFTWCCLASLWLFPRPVWRWYRIYRSYGLYKYVDITDCHLAFE